MKAAALGAVAMISGGCAPIPPVEEDVPIHGGGGKCESGPAQKLIGREKSQEIGAEALRLSGAATMRWLPEGSVVTMEYREGRLNIHLDRQNRIARITCG